MVDHYVAEAAFSPKKGTLALLTLTRPLLQHRLAPRKHNIPDFLEPLSSPSLIQE